MQNIRRVFGPSDFGSDIPNPSIHRQSDSLVDKKKGLNAPLSHTHTHTQSAVYLYNNKKIVSWKTHVSVTKQNRQKFTNRDILLLPSTPYLYLFGFNRLISASGNAVIVGKQKAHKQLIILRMFG